MGFGFNTDEYERTVGTGSSEALPIGFYGLVITRSIMKLTNDKAGKYLEVEFDITEPAEHGNRKFWDRFNIFNNNAAAQRIGREQLSDLLNAIGLNGDAEPEDMVGASVNAYLLIEPGSNGYGPKNKCGKYMPSGTTKEEYQAWKAQAKGAAKAAAPVAQAAKATPAAGVPSWKKTK